MWGDVISMHWPLITSPQVTLGAAHVAAELHTGNQANVLAILLLLFPCLLKTFLCCFVTLPPPPLLPALCHSSCLHNEASSLRSWPPSGKALS